MSELLLSDSLSQTLQSDKRYKFPAYEFTMEAIKYAHDILELGQPLPRKNRREEDDEPPQDVDRDISAADICLAVKIYAVEQYGLLAKATLSAWGINSTYDIGQIVNNLIQCGELRASDKDKLEDFNNVYDFSIAFNEQFSFD